MAKFRNKPVVVEAHQWFKNGDHPDDDSREIVGDDDVVFLSEGLVVRGYRTPDMDGHHHCKHCGRLMHDHGWIDTARRGHNVCPGDYVVKGGKGEIYPCKPGVFLATYEEIGGDHADT